MLEQEPAASNKEALEWPVSFHPFIDPRAAEYAGYKPKPYVVDEEKLLAQLRARRQAILAEPRISDSVRSGVFLSAAFFERKLGA